MRRIHIQITLAHHLANTTQKNSLVITITCTNKVTCVQGASESTKRTFTLCAYTEQDASNKHQVHAVLFSRVYYRFSPQKQFAALQDLSFL